jgi:hypothetical protein
VKEPSISSAPALSADVWRLFTSRVVRLFAYGSLSDILILYLDKAGLSEREIGLLLTMTVIADTGISLWTATRADRIGRSGRLCGNDSQNRRRSFFGAGQLHAQR